MGQPQFEEKTDEVTSDEADESKETQLTVCAAA
jgi:hypothetical protein